MFKFDVKLWNFRVRKTVIVSLAVPLLSVLPQAPIAYAAEFKATDNFCVQDITGSTDVTVIHDGNSCVVIFKTTAANATTSYTWKVPSNASTVSVLVVAGGGSGGIRHNAGGGAGGYIYQTNVGITPSANISIGVGKGGNAIAATTNSTAGPSGTSGAASSFGATSAAGGGGGGGVEGGSGGGACCSNAAGLGNRPILSPPQGNNGGTGTRGSSESNWSGGGGGGAGSPGGSSTSTSSIAPPGDNWTTGTVTGGAGGDGISNTITGSAACYAAGGGGGVAASGSDGGAGGKCGSVISGGKGGKGYSNSAAVQGGDGTGSGGGGGGFEGGNNGASGRGGSGIVVVRYNLPTVTFSANGGSGAASATSLNVNASGQVTAAGKNTLQRNGYVFAGWNTAANGKGTNYAVGASYTPMVDTTLYAQWNSNIQYNGNTATSTRAIESTTALSSAADTTLSNGKLAKGQPIADGLVLNLDGSDAASVSGSSWANKVAGATGAQASATMVGSPTYDAAEGAFTLNGTSQYFTLGTTNYLFNGALPFTLNLSIKPSDVSKDNCLIGNLNGGQGATYTFRISGGLLYGTRNVSPYSVNGTTRVPDGEIQYASMTFDGSNMKLFLNGNLQATSALINGSVTWNGGARIGGCLDSNAASRFFKGKIYNAQIYNRALAASEIATNHQNLLPEQKVSKTNFTLAPWNTVSSGTGTSYGSVVTDIAALPTPYLQLLPENYNTVTKKWDNTTNAGPITIKGTPSKNTSNNGKFNATGNFPTISGGVNDGINIKNSEMPAYTLCVVARYKGGANATAGSQGRMIGAETNANWLSGYYNGNVGEFLHTGWNYQTYKSDITWHYHCDSGNRVYWDGERLVSGWTNQTNTTLPPLAINNNGIANSQTSDWEIGELIIYDQVLSDSQVESINRYFKNKFGLVSGSTTAASVVSVLPPSNYASTGDTTLNATWGSAVTYDGNKQTGGIAPNPTLITGASGALAANSGSLAKTGWRFDGWNTNESGTGTTYPAGSTYLNSGNVTLYAKWSLPLTFPAPSIEPNNLTPYMRYKASDYDATNKIWRDSSGNGRNTSLVGGSPTLVTTTANANGSNKAFQVVQGLTTDNIRFENPTTTTGKYTLFSLVRYNSADLAKQERILNSLDDLWFTGHHGDKAGVSYHEGTWLKSTSTVTPVLNWVMGTDYPSNYRSNGISQVTSGGGANIRTLSINGASEKSDFQVAEIILYDKILSLAEIRQVEDYLASTYGLIGYTSSVTYTTNTTLPIGLGVGGKSDRFTSINGFGNKTFSVSPTISGITIDTSTANSVALVVSSSVAAGTYVETITATDELGYTSRHVVTVTVSANARFEDATPSTLVATSGRAATMRLNAINGIGLKVFSMNQIGGTTTTRVTLDTSTAASNYVTLKVDTFTAPGTYAFSVVVTDDTKLRVTQVITLTINSPPQVQSQIAPVVAPVLTDLRVNLDAGNTNSYSGSGTTWNDISGEGNNFTLTGSPTYSTANGGSLTLGSGKYASRAALPTMTRFTLEAWFKLSSLPSGAVSPTIITNGWNGTNLNYSIFWNSTSKCLGAGYVTSNTWYQVACSNIKPSINTWYQVAFTYNGTNLALYLNGNLDSSLASSVAPISATGSNVYINRGWDNTHYFDGEFPVARIYNRALSAAEITQNYNALSPRFLNTPTNSVTLNTTQGVATSSAIYYAGLGTGVKTFTLSPAAAGITIDTSTVNTVRLNVSNTAGATNATTARTVTQTITAYDAAGQVAATPIYVTTVINPPIVITPAIANTVTTTFGVAAYDTFTATRGAGGPYTFTVTSSANQSAFTMSKPSANVGLLTIANNLPAGTYYETITATDSLTASTNYLLTVIVNPGMTLAGAVSNSVATTLGKSASLRVNIANGTGAKTLTISSPAAGITLDSSTVGSGYVTINVGANVPVNTYSITLNIRDSIGATTSGVFTVVVNRWPKITSNGFVTNGLSVNFDAGNPASYSGSGTSWISTVGAKTVTLQGSSGLPVYSSDSGGVIQFNNSAPTTQKQFAAGSIENTVLTSYTVEAWAKFDSFPTTDVTGIVMDKLGTKVNFGLFYGSIAGATNCDGAAGLHVTHYDGTWRCSKAVTGLSLGTWYHIVGTYDSATGFKMYLNGLLQSGATVSTSGNAPGDTSNREIYIAKRHNAVATTGFFPGSIPVARLYSRPLASDEVSQNFSAEGSRFLAATSGQYSLVTTQGVATSVLNVPVFQGTGNKTIALTGNNPAITLNTSGSNQYTMILTETLTATNSTTARTIYETVTATDSVTAATTLAYTITVNPPVQLAVTASSVTTTSGIAAYDTFTATYGTGNKTFVLTGSPSTSGFTLTQSNNVAVLKVEPTVNPGTYYETITATDSVDAVKALGITVTVQPALVVLGPTASVMTNGVDFKTPTFTISGGATNFGVSVTGTLGASFLSIESIATRIFRLSFASTTPQGTYYETVTVTDGNGAKATAVMTLQVNGPVTLSGPQVINKTYGTSSTTLYQSTEGSAPYTLGGSSICATNKLTNGLYTIEEFRSTGACNWAAPTGVTAIDALIVGGGGGGGFGSLGGGGGAGQVLYSNAPFGVSPGVTYSVTVGPGGQKTMTNSSGPSWRFGYNGEPSSFGSFVAKGGGGGGGDTRAVGNSGGSGGGGATYGSDSGIAASDKNTYTNWTSLGFAGGESGGGGGSGGGGAGGVGTKGGAAGSGVTISTFKNGDYKIGGGGGGYQGGLGATAFGGGNSLAAASGFPCSTEPCVGATNTGGGGGAGAAGGSGFVAVKYLTPSETTNDTITVEVTNFATSPAKFVVRVPELTRAGTYIQTLSISDRNGSGNSYPITINVAKATPTVALSLPGSVEAAKYGTPVTISAATSTAGQVLFKNASTNIAACTAVATSSGIASCSWIPTVRGTTTLKATLTPTDTTNYNNSLETSFSVNVLQADTLTVTAGNETFEYKESAVSVTKPFTYSGLVSIDSLTAVSMIYSGTANDSTSYNSSTAPTKAGTYVVTPDTATAGISTIAANYRAIVLVPGTLTVTRKAPTLALVYANSNAVTYSPTATIATTDTSRSGTGVKSFATSTSLKCSVDSSTALVSVIEAGTCSVTMTVAQDPNYLTATVDRDITINKGSRTIALTSGVSTLKYTETTTVTTTLSGGGSDGLVTYSLNSTPGCSFDGLSGELTSTSGTLTCTLNATVAEGVNYLTASTTAALAITMAKADAPTITVDTVTAVDYVPGQSAQISPTYTVTGFKGSDAAASLTLTYGLVSTAVGSFTYSSTLTPTDAGTYSITPSALVMSTGLVTNYNTPNYAAAVTNFTVNRIEQAPITFDNVNGEVDVPFTLTARGGSSTGTATFAVVSGTGCTIVTGQLRATTAGKCILTVSRAEDRNYLAITSDTVTVSVRNFVLTPVFVFGNGTTGITLASNTPLTKGPDRCTVNCTPIILFATPDAGSISAGTYITITGTNLNGVLRVIFNVFTEATDFTNTPSDSDNTIVVQIPAGVVASDSDSIEVETINGTSPRFYDFTVLP